MNLLQLFGRLGADPETRFTANGQKVTTFRIACNTRKGGNDITTWWRVTVWGERLDKMISYLKKGSAVIVMGTMKNPEIYTDREGRQQVSLEITAESLHFSPFGGRSDQANEQNAGGQQAPAEGNNISEPAPFAYSGNTNEVDEEPMPF